MIAAARSAYFNYAARVSLHDAALGFKLVNRGMKLANEFRAEVDGLDPRTAGQYLSSLRSTGDFSIMDMITLHNEGVDAYLVGRIKGKKNKTRLLNNLNAVSAIDNIGEERVRELSETIDSEAGAQARIDTLGLEAKVLQDRADSLMMDNIKALIGSEALRAEIAALQKSDVGKDGFGSMVEQYKAVLEGGGDIAQLRKIYDSVAPSMISDLANSGIPLGEVAVGAAEVSETSEQLFDTKDKLTQEKHRKANTAVDKLGKQFISTVRRQGDPPKAQSETSKKFKELIEDVANLKDFTQGGFISRYKKLGGDADLALEVYAAAKRQVAYKKKRSQTRANEAALKSAVKKEEAIQRKIIRDLEKIEGFGDYAKKLSGAELTNLVGMLKRFSGVKSSQTEAEFRKALTDAKTKDGGRKFSNEVVDAAVEKGKIVKAAKARASEAEAALKAAEQADKKAAATALRKAKKAADAADRDLKNIQGYGESKTEAEKIEARKTPTSVLDAYTAVKSEMTDAEFKSALEGLVTKEGKTRLSPELVKEAISRGKVVKAKKLAVSAAKKALREAKAAEKKAAKKKLTAAERGVVQSEKALKSIRKKLDEKVKAAKKVTPSTVIQKYTTTKDGSRISEEQLRKELSEIKRDADGERLLSDAAIDEAVGVANKLLKSNLKKKDLRQREGAENRLLNLFKARTSRKAPRSLSLRQHLQDFFNDVSIKSFDAVERRVALKKFIEARGVGMTEAQINDMVLRATAQFEAKLTELKVAEINRFSKQLDSGKVDIAMLNRIIRLQVLDPNKSFTELYATEKGYKGFNEEQFAAVMRDQQIISKLGLEHTASRNAAARQLRVVNLATGLNPRSRDLINGYIKGSIYSGVSSQMVGIASGVTANLELFAGTLGNGTFDMLKEQDPRALADTMTVWGTAMRAGLVRSLAETRNVLKHNVSSVNQIQGGQETSLSYDHKIYNDPLIIAFDKNLAETKRLSAAIASGNGKKGDRARQAAALLKVGLASQHIVFRGLSTADAAATQIFARTATEVEAFRLARKSGLTIEEYTETVKTANALYDKYKKDLTTMEGLENLTPNERHMFALDKVKKEIFESFTKYLPSGDPETKLAYIDQIYEGAVADIQDRLGTGQSSKSAVGIVNDWSAKAARELPLGAALFPAVRTTGNIADYLTWHMPVMNLLRLRRLGLGKIDAERLSAIQEVFPNIKSIEQATKRRTQARTANFSSLMVAALTIMNAGLPDDEKWFHFTGGYPVGDTHARDLWAEDGWTENMLVLGWGGFRTKWRMDRGLSSFMLPILYAGKTASRLYTGDTENRGADAVGFMAGILPFTDQLFSHGAAMTRRSGAFDGDKPTEYKGVAQELSANTARLVIPYRGLLSLVAKNTSSVDRQSDLNFIQEVLKPVALPKSDNVIDAVNVLGEPLYRNTGVVARAVASIGFPITFHLKQTGSPENRRAERVTSMLFRYKYAPKPKKFAALAKVAHEDYGVTLTAQQYSEIIASAGRQLAVALDKNTKGLRSLGVEQAANRKAWVAEKVAIDAAGEGRAIDPYDKPFNKEVSSFYKDVVSDAIDKVLGK